MSIKDKKIDLGYQHWFHTHSDTAMFYRYLQRELGIWTPNHYIGDETDRTFQSIKIAIRGGFGED